MTQTIPVAILTWHIIHIHIKNKYYQRQILLQQQQQQQLKLRQEEKQQLGREVDPEGERELCTKIQASLHSQGK